MYSSGQIIYDLDTKKPVRITDVWNGTSYPKNHTHFIKPTGRFWKEVTEYVSFCPKTLAEARKLLKENKIVPAPVESRIQPLEFPTVDVNNIKHRLLQALDKVDVEPWC